MNDDFDLSKLVRKKRTGINSKAKGGRFERKISDILNSRFNTTDFCRTPGSGAFATTHKLPDHLKIYGDLITPKRFKFILECKSGYSKEGVNSLFNPNSILRGMIVQAKRDADKCGKNFIVVIGQDRSDIIVVVDSDKGFMIENIRNANVHYIDCVFGTTRLAICKLNDLLKLDDSVFLDPNNF